MRNWCAGFVMSALVALPLRAQQKSSGTGDETTSASANAEKSAASGKAWDGGRPAAAKGVFGLPAIPKPAPFPAAAAAADTRAPGRLLPRYEIAAMYDYVNFAPGSPFADFDGHGGSRSLTYKTSRWVGLSGGGGGFDFAPGSIITHLWCPPKDPASHTHLLIQ